MAVDDGCIEQLAREYRRFSAEQAAGRSPLYVELTRQAAEDRELLEILCELPPAKRQVNLLLAAVRHLHGGFARDWPEFRERFFARREEALALTRARRTQTNEPARCATLLPVLASLPQPLALLEVGTSAGLCLLPGEGDRLELLRAAVAIARLDPPRVVRGDLRYDLAALAEHAPADATLVVFHTAVLGYVRDAADRLGLARTVRELDARWIANEPPSLVQTRSPAPARPVSGAAFLLSLDAAPVAWADPHGAWLTWLDEG